MRIAAAFVILFAVRCAGAELHFTNEGFSITLPPRWAELKPETMRQLRDRPPEELPVPMDGQVHLFQAADAPTPLTLPLIHVQVLKTGRIPDLFVRQLLLTNDPAALLRRFLREQGLSDANLREISFDTNRFTITADALHARVNGRHRALSRIFFTEDGALVVNALAHEADYTKWSATFQQVVNSVTIPDASRYRLRELDLSSGARDWIIVLGGLGGMLLLFGIWIWWTRVRGPSTLEY